jgi:hypothetical protein
MRIREVWWIGLGRTTVYEAIKSRALTARRYGRRTLVLGEELRAFLRNPPQKVTVTGNTVSKGPQRSKLWTISIRPSVQPEH